MWARCRYVCCACAIKSQNENFYTFLAFLIPQFVVFPQFLLILYDFCPSNFFVSLFYLIHLHLHSCSDSHFNAYIRDFISTEREGERELFSPIIFTTVLSIFLYGWATTHKSIWFRNFINEHAI